MALLPERGRYAAGSLLGRPRRWRFLERLPKNAVGAEVGVFRGEYTRHIVRIAKPRELHLIDGWWELYGERYPDWGAYTDHGRLTTRQAFADAQKAAPTAEFHIGDDLEILERFPDRFFDWVYLDTSHQYEHTLQELDVLQRKADIICGDDWVEDPGSVHRGLSVAVTEFCDRNGWAIDRSDPFGQWLIVASSDDHARAGQPR